MWQHKLATHCMYGGMPAAEDEEEEEEELRVEQRCEKRKPQYIKLHVLPK